MKKIWRNDRCAATVMVATSSVLAMVLALLPNVAAAATSVRSCESLAKMSLPGATITAVTTVAAGAYQFPDGPAAGNLSR